MAFVSKVVSLEVDVIYYVKWVLVYFTFSNISWEFTIIWLWCLTYVFQQIGRGMYYPRNREKGVGLVVVIVICLVVVCAASTAPCDKTRRVFTERSGVITDGPTNSNYTQVSCLNIHSKQFARPTTQLLIRLLSFRILTVNGLSRQLIKVSS